MSIDSLRVSESDWLLFGIELRTILTKSTLELVRVATKAHYRLTLAKLLFQLRWDSSLSHKLLLNLLLSCSHHSIHYLVHAFNVLNAIVMTQIDLGGIVDLWSKSAIFYRSLKFVILCLLENFIFEPTLRLA